MTAASKQDLASKQLDRVLGFFPRVDAKASVLFAVDTGILAILTLNIHLADFKLWYLALPAIFTVGLVAASLFYVYRCHFPHLSGGASSLIYFREIAQRTEAKFIEESIAQTDDAYMRDLLGQVWRNSEILSIKYDSIKIAFILAGIALVPWLTFLGEAAIWHSPGLVLK